MRQPRFMLLAVLLLPSLLNMTAAQVIPPAPAGSPIKVYTFSESQLIPLLRGEVLILGNEFPGAVFQRAVLDNLRQKKITVRVLTGAGSLNYFSPIKNAGGQVRTFPGKITGAVAVAGGALIAVKDGKYLVVSGPNVAETTKTQFEQAWLYAR